MRILCYSSSPQKRISHSLLKKCSLWCVGKMLTKNSQLHERGSFPFPHINGSEKSFLVSD